MGNYHHNETNEIKHTAENTTVHTNEKVTRRSCCNDRCACVCTDKIVTTTKAEQIVNPEEHKIDIHRSSDRVRFRQCCQLTCND